MNHRVCITAYSYSGPVGTGTSSFLKALTEVSSAIKEQTLWPYEAIRWASVRERTNSKYKLERSRMLQECIEELNVKPEDISSDASLAMGVGVYPEVKNLVLLTQLVRQEQGWDQFGKLDFEHLKSAYQYFQESGLNNVPNLEREIQKQIDPQSVLWEISDSLHINGAQRLHSNLCVSSMQAIGDGYHWIRSGKSKQVIVGGLEEYSFLSSFAFARLGVYSKGRTLNTACTPFDSKRSGVVLGEGCALFLLESEESAKQREAKILAYLDGYACTSNNYHITTSPENGDGLYRCMETAWKYNQNTNPDLVIAHGTSTINNDLSEGRAINRLFGNEVWVQSIKAYTGHTLAAAGAINLLSAVLQMENSFIAANPFLNQMDPRIDLKLVGQKGVPRANLDSVLINSAGFGGINSCVVVKRPFNKNH